MCKRETNCAVGISLPTSPAAGWARESAVFPGGSCDWRRDSRPLRARGGCRSGSGTQTSGSVVAPGRRRSGESSCSESAAPDLRGQERGWAAPGRRCDPGGRRGRGAWTARPVTGGARARARCSLRPRGEAGPPLGAGRGGPGPRPQVRYAPRRIFRSRVQRDNQELGLSLHPEVGRVRRE